MTNRIDHTDCTHDRTPKGRAYCRNMRRDAIMRAQAAYADLWAVQAGSPEKHDEYYALVDDVRFRLGVTLSEAYDVVERGPVIH